MSRGILCRCTCDEVSGCSTYFNGEGHLLWVIDVDLVGVDSDDWA